VTGEIQVETAPPNAEQRVGVYPLKRRGIFLCGCLILLAILPYLPLYVQPFVSDDYVQLDLGRKYGPVSAWGYLATDALYRCRATSIVMTHWTENLFGTEPLPFYVTSVVMHALNSLLVLAVGWKLGLGGVRSFLAAFFFAIQSGHQEAVMWYAALPELLLFFFCGLFLLSWNVFSRTGSVYQFGFAMAWFFLALLSKEAAVAVVPVAVAMLYQRGRNVWLATPLAIAAAVYAAAISRQSRTIYTSTMGRFRCTPLSSPFGRRVFGVCFGCGDCWELRPCSHGNAGL
jgi:hypothetical protein